MYALGVELASPAIILICWVWNWPLQLYSSCNRLNVFVRASSVGASCVNMYARGI